MTTPTGIVRSIPIDDFLAGAGGSSAGDVAVERNLRRTITLEAVVLALAVVMSTLLTRSSIA